MGDTFCEGSDQEGLRYVDYVRQIDSHWLILLAPGIAFDVAFIWVFRKPRRAGRIGPRLSVPELNSPVVHMNMRKGIGGVGLSKSAQKPPKGPQHKQLKLKMMKMRMKAVLAPVASSGDLKGDDKPITGLNRPVSEKMRRRGSNTASDDGSQRTS